MPHISKKELDKEYSAHLYKDLLKIFEKTNSNKKVASQFFTKTEKIMFAKRLGAILMLSKGFSVYSVSDSLHMSPSTINLMALRYEEGKYNTIIQSVQNNLNIWKLIDLISTAGGLMPAITGKRRKANNS